MEKSKEEKLGETFTKLATVLNESGLNMAEAAGTLGAILAIMATQSEENSFFVSFMNSFTRTYHANKKGDSITDISNKIKIGGEKDEHLIPPQE